MDWNYLDGERMYIKPCSSLQTIKIASWLSSNIGKKRYWVDYKPYFNGEDFTNVVEICFYYPEDAMRFKLMGFSGYA